MSFPFWAGLKTVEPAFLEKTNYRPPAGVGCGMALENEPAVALEAGVPVPSALEEYVLLLEELLHPRSEVEGGR